MAVAPPQKSPMANFHALTVQVNITSTQRLRTRLTLPYGGQPYNTNSRSTQSNTTNRTKFPSARAGPSLGDPVNASALIPMTPNHQSSSLTVATPSPSRWRIGGISNRWARQALIGFHSAELPYCRLTVNEPAMALIRDHRLTQLSLSLPPVMANPIPSWPRIWYLVGDNRSLPSLCTVHGRPSHEQVHVACGLGRHCGLGCR